jgi:hypothetical protein
MQNAIKLETISNLITSPSKITEIVHELYGQPSYIPLMCVGHE